MESSPTLFRRSLVVVTLIGCAQTSLAERGTRSIFPSWPSAYDVVWTSPSRDSSGSMPIGNGDIGLNVWAEEDGELVFYISKTDAWSENARLLKVGRVRIGLTPNPFSPGAFFRQRLKLEKGESEILAGGKNERLTMRIRVDANRPVIIVEGESERPLNVRAALDLWRRKKRKLEGAELVSAYGLHGGPQAVFVYPDTIVSRQEQASLRDSVTWFHRNERSIWPMTMRLQGLEPLMAKEKDPLLHRTFGGVMWSAELRKTGDATLASKKPLRRFRVMIPILTAQTNTAEEWLTRCARLLEKEKAASAEARRNAHDAWWRAFWNRSRIQIVGRAGAASITTNDLPLRIGADSNGYNAFRGLMRRAWLFRRALTAKEIAVLAKEEDAPFRNDPSLIGDWALDELRGGAAPNRVQPNLPARVVGNVDLGEKDGRKGARFMGRGWLEVESAPRLNATQAVTLAAWIAPDKLGHGGARILDKSRAGTANGYLLDTYPGNSLRMIVEAGTLIEKACLPVGKWTFAAATFDAATGEQRLYIDGRLVRSQQLGDEAFRSTQGYALQRFIAASSGRGAYPIKFNGSIFTVDAQVGKKRFDADYRRWGGPYWFQNTRLAYWPMLAAGDFDSMLPLFRMYRDMLPLCRERTQIYFRHPGAFFPETLYFWGCYANTNYGWRREGKPPSWVANTYIRHYYSGGLELVALMLDYYAFTEDRSFAREFLLPVAKEVLAFYDRHYPRDAEGRLVLKPAQSLETWQNVIDPLPDIAGLHWTLDGLLRLPDDLVDGEQRATWERLRRAAPPLPMGEEKGERFLLPARKILGPIRNVENPELYAVFPFRLYGVGRPDIAIGKATFARRRFKGTGGWKQDAIQAACLGLADVAARYVFRNFTTHHSGSRFPAFWGPNYDWIPDQDHGSVAMMALQTMIVQEVGDTLFLLPAWPKGLNVSFRLHAPRGTVVEGEHIDGRWRSLRVTPERKWNVVKTVKDVPETRR